MPVGDDEFIPTRASLLTRLKNWDDQEGWQRFFETYWRMLYSVARRSGLGEAEAQDVVQETVVAVARKMPDFRYDPALGSFKGWLCTIIRRRIIDFLRKQGKAPKRHHALPSADGGDGPDTLGRIPDPAGDAIGRIYEEEWELHLFNTALDRVRREVNYEQFQMFDCYAIKGWPVEEVARILNTTPPAVYTAKHRITRLIKAEVARLEKEPI